LRNLRGEQNGVFHPDTFISISFDLALIALIEDYNRCPLRPREAAVELN